MATYSSEERDRLLSLDSEGILREMAEGKHGEPTSYRWNEVAELLTLVKAREEAANSARIEAREAEGLAVAREAVIVAREANVVASRAERWAMYAAIAAVVALILSVMDGRG